MKPGYLLVVLLPCLILLSSGCIGNAGSSPTGGQAIGPGVSSSSLFNHSAFTWFSYRVILSNATGPMIHTYGYTKELSEGQWVNHFNFTLDHSPNSLIRPFTATYLDVWSDPASGKTLRIHEVDYESGIRAADLEVDPANFSLYGSQDLSSPEFLTSSIYPYGNESVIADDTNYVAMKYSGGLPIDLFTFWSTPTVPVPVKIYEHRFDGDSTSELIGWG